MNRSSSFRHSISRDISVFFIDRTMFVARIRQAITWKERGRKSKRRRERASRWFYASLSAQGLEESFSSWSHGSSRRLVLGIWNWYKSIFYTFFFTISFKLLNTFQYLSCNILSFSRFLCPLWLSAGGWWFNYNDLCKRERSLLKMGESFVTKQLFYECAFFTD